MSRTLLFVTMSGLMMSAAVAQAPTPSTTASPTPPTATSTPEVAPAQAGDEWLASKLKGTAVVGSDDQKIGEISDVLFDTMEHVRAYIVRIGGIFGIGAKEIALEPSAFQEMPVVKGRPQEKQFVVLRLKVSMTKDQLERMAEFKPSGNPPTTTGAAPAARPPTEK